MRSLVEAMDSLFFTFTETKTESVDQFWKMFCSKSVATKNYQKCVDLDLVLQNATSFIECGKLLSLWSNS